jgi:tetratricopeptide (TPR) repeat protein
VAADPLIQQYDEAYGRHDLFRALHASDEIMKRDGRSPANVARHARLHRLLNDFPNCQQLLAELEPAAPELAAAERAELLVDRGLYDRALTVAGELAQREANDVVAFRVRARVLRQRRQIDDSLSTLALALRIHPLDVQLRAEHAATTSHRDNAKRDPDTAWQLIEDILHVDPFNETALTALAAFWDREGEVMAAFKTLLKRAPADWLLYSYYAGFRINVTREADRGLDLANAALRANPRAQWAWLKKMDALQLLGRHDELRQAAEDAVHAVPLSGRLQRNLLADLRDSGRLAEAETQLAVLKKEEPESIEWIEAEIDLLRRQGRIKEALVLAASSEGRSKNESLQRTIATTYVDARQYANARRILEALPASTGVWSDRILCEINEGTYEQAVKVADQAATEFPSAPSVLGLKAWLLAHQGEFANAYATLDRIRTLNRASEYPDIIKGEVQLMQCDFDGAHLTARTMHRRHPDRIDLFQMMCEVALHNDDSNDAIKWADEVLKRDASRTVAIQIKAVALAQSNRDKAIELLDEAMEQFPYSAGLRACRGLLRLADDDVYGARKDFEEALGDSPAAVVAKTGLGAIAYRVRRLPEARYWFKRAVAVQPASVEALANLAWSYAVGSTPSELNAAEKYASEGLHYVRDHPRGLAVMAVVAFKRGERRKALRLMARASASASRDLDLAVNLATMQRVTGHLAEAEVTIQKVLSADPLHARGRIELAAVLLKHHKTEEARIAAETAVDENPSSGAGWRILAAAHVVAGDTTSAEGILRRAMMQCDESELPDVRVDLARILLTSTASSSSDARLLEAREHLAAALEIVEDHSEALLLRAWSDLKLERPAIALRGLDRIRNPRMQGYLISLRRAAVEQRASIAAGTGTKLQWFLASLITFQLALVWGLRLSDSVFAEGAEFASLVTLLCGLLLLTILLPRLAVFKLGTIVEAELTKPPATASVDAIITPLSEFEMQPVLTPVVGARSYDT